MRAGRAVRLALAAAALTGLAGCANLDYYWQSASGHWQLMRAARPVEAWMEETQTSEALRRRLRLAQRMRAFAVSELHLPDNASYRRYAELGRRAAVWTVVAAPEFSLEARTWCFPVAGCVAYRGYFLEDQARAEAAALQAQGLETHVQAVPAYSTLGWMNWAGGDPLLDTFIHFPEGELARLIFHELAHQRVYVADDTVFNESFATAVERLGGERWLALHGSPAARAEYAAFDGRRRAFRALVRASGGELAALYATPAGESERRARKQQALQRFRARYAALRAGWGDGAPRHSGYDAWVAQANNASFAAQAAYDELVPGFEALFEREGRDWRRFYDAVKRLAEQPQEARRRALKEMPHG
ncbi:aminopeptidase [Ramlibacter sp. 2FC]|uniref:aminopeptidase n=1 Tax=Ramlibacter sp. 2FC TaxID=2502188 RepID=UPI0010F772D7|nr:aminopeptidase [Ramlibacter sp. 2FC]